MAESRLDQTTHRGVPQASVRAAAIDPNAAVMIERADGRTYAPLSDPAGSVPGISPVSPPPASESELRAKLAAALDDQHAADERLVEAQGAHARAVAYVESCGRALDGFADLDAAMSGAVADALRAGVDVVNDDLMQRTLERERARASYAAAGTAVDTLAAELAQARDKAAAAAGVVDKLITGILSFEATRIAEQHARLIAEADRVREWLLSFNLFSANQGAVLTPSVRKAIGLDTGTLARQRDKLPWITAAAQLRADPMATVHVGCERE